MPKANHELQKKALSKLEMKSLEERRSDMSLTFAKKCLQNPKTADYFPVKNQLHSKNLRINEKYKINTALKERYKRSAIPVMQNQLNEDWRNKRLYYQN